MTALLELEPQKLWTPDQGAPIFKLPDTRPGDRFVGERPSLVTHKGQRLLKLAEEVAEWDKKAHPFRSVVERKLNGDVVVHAPALDIMAEVELFLREERIKAECKRQGLRYIAGGAAGNWTFTNNTRTYILDGTFDWDTDSFKEALFLSTSNIGAASTTFAGVTNEHAAANGYSAGGIAVTIALSGTTTVTVDSTTNPVWTASGGSITARFCVLYEVSGNVACYFLLDSTPADVTATDGNTLTITHHANGVFQLS